MITEPLIKFNKVYIKQQQNEILNDISLDINEGEFVYFVGKTGSGKSSLLKSIYGDIEIEVGDIVVDGQSLRKSRKKHILSLRRKLGIIFQDFELLMDRSIEDNLKFVMRATGWKGKKNIQSKATELLEMVEMKEKANSKPHLLSGGEQQRVAIARALINDPKIIIADEPTGNLDPETSLKIMELMKNISNSNQTIIMATHDYDIIQKFPGRIIEFKDKKILE
ncbi:MAG: ATP-binding cassette domain-containing protein [Bacteroidota bacterium]|nr:ATP-binding cassette domain-containing protein [Bacteroidota bacterium]MEC7944777.1 ATP-binding cassette domain-containing protein [Bacteroidota bacterium]MEC7999244.1 ATP-binding cassette domain-containing protein [Bacteroidota bacterium]MEC8031075.1 ATP-binding cassette domain-containing protein [Bacteroidota bacterium]MEC8514397.1 ATP-binding cassette domain-containing protein [Bacteroidota bacterium]|tara:strand:- start:375 stop:1043 length:669 start_codon:yes stop_codon:yes gene_type:complete